MKNKEKQQGVIELQDEVLEEIGGGKIGYATPKDPSPSIPTAPPPPKTPTTKEKLQALGQKIVDGLRDFTEKAIPW